MENLISGKYFNLESDQRFPLYLPNVNWQNLKNQNSFICPVSCHIYLLSGHNNLYVGSNSDGGRVYSHKSKLNRGVHENGYMQNVVNKYGLENFYFQPLVEIPPEYVEYRDEIENSYIKLFNTYHNGYNLCEFAGEAGLGREPWNKGKKDVYSNEQLEKMSKGAKQKYLNGFIPYNKGQQRSEEVKRKISDANKGKTAWNKGKSDIYSEETLLKMSENRKGKCCGDNHPLFGKKHTEEFKKKVSETKKGIPNLKRRKSIRCIETGIIYNSVQEASDINRISQANISRVLTGKGKTAGNLHWEYINEENSTNNLNQ